ncbi:hypothetical protein ACVIQT_002093 [Bradyrhizobium diazoefficiens]
MIQDFSKFVDDARVRLLEVHDTLNNNLGSQAVVQQARDENGHIITLAMIVVISHPAKCGAGPAFVSLMGDHLDRAIRAFDDDAARDVDVTIRLPSRTTATISSDQVGRDQSHQPRSAPAQIGKASNDVGE